MQSLLVKIVLCLAAVVLVWVVLADVLSVHIR